MSYEDLINELGYQVLTALSSVDIESVVLWPSEHDSTAHLEIFLHNDSWSSRTKAIEALVDLRSVMLERGLSFSYGFQGAEAPYIVDNAQPVTAAEPDRSERVLVFAA